LNGRRDVGLSAPTLSGFVRLATNPRVLDRPWPIDAVLDRIQEWLSDPPSSSCSPLRAYSDVVPREGLSPLAGARTGYVATSALRSSHS
jgi:hypothetical protein